MRIREEVVTEAKEIFSVLFSPMISVLVPEGAVAGTTIQVVNPDDGTPFTVEVPEGVEPGQTISVPKPLPVATGTIVEPVATSIQEPVPPQGVVASETPVAGVVVVHQQPVRFHQAPMRIKCPNCGQEGVTRTTKSPGVVTWGSCLGLACIGCWCGCCLIPFFVDDLKDTSHFCPNCDTYVGRHNFIS